MDKIFQNFVKYLLKFVDFVDNQKVLSASLKLDEFVKNRINFKDFLAIVLAYTGKLKKTDKTGRWLCDATKRLSKSKQELTDESLASLRQLISHSIAKYEVKFLDNGFSLVISGNNFFMGEAKKEIENHDAFKSGKIREVRFIARSVLHVDTNLEKHLWHGVSVFVWTNILNLTEPDTNWDLSGKDSANKYYGDAGTDSSGNGIDGKDGHAGESGGNVLIKASEVRNGVYLTIVTNGGNGTAGQNGGSGNNGDPGASVTQNDLNAVPSATALRWHSGNDQFYNAKRHIEHYAIKYSDVTYHRNSYGRWGDGYIQAPFSSGKSITYVCNHLNKTLCLIKGVKGTQGGRGGSMGNSGDFNFSKTVRFCMESHCQQQKVIPYMAHILK